MLNKMLYYGYFYILYSNIKFLFTYFINQLVFFMPKKLYFNQVERRRWSREGYFYRYSITHDALYKNLYWQVTAMMIVKPTFSMTLGTFTM
jgi:hypothetical protein